MLLKEKKKVMTKLAWYQKNKETKKDTAGMCARHESHCLVFHKSPNLVDFTGSL